MDTPASEGRGAYVIEHQVKSGPVLEGGTWVEDSSECKVTAGR